MVSSRQATVIRPLTRSHLAALIGVVNADALPGQPPCGVGALLGAAGLRDAGPRRGGALRPAGAAWNSQTLVAIGDEVLGAVCFGRAGSGRTGVIRWLHAREDPGVVADLLDQAITRLSGCETVDAFVAGGIGPVAAGLPDGRSTTRDALAARNFTGKPIGRFLYRALQVAPPAVSESPRIRVTPFGNQHRLTVAGPAGGQVAEATVAVLAPGHGLLQWIEVDPAHRGDGLGGRLLTACLRYLHHLGVRQVVGHLDDHNLTADDGHGRIGAHIIFSRAGFVTNAELTTYSRTR